MTEPHRGWSARLTRLLAGALGGEANPIDGGRGDPVHDLELAEAWAGLHAATPPGWFVDRPGPRHGGTSTMYAFDQTEKAHIGRRSREWTVEAPSEIECVYEMAHCLRKISEGRLPK